MLSQVGQILKGKVTGLSAFGAFVKLENGESGMVHISEVANVYVKEIKDHLAEGQDVTVKVIQIGDNNKIALSIKQALPKEPAENKRPAYTSNSDHGFRPQQKTSAASSGNSAFEDMMAKFKAESDEKISALKRNGDNNSRPRRR